MTKRARAQVASKRGGAQRRLLLDEAQLLAGDNTEHVIEIHGVLDEPKEVFPRQRQLVELRDEASKVLQVSHPWAYRRQTTT